MRRHFFFYGTLRPDVAQGLPARLAEGLEPVAMATVRGRIFARLDPQGAYPVLFRGGRGLVHGVVCRAEGGFSGRELAALNRYEGADGALGEYVRRPLRVTLADGRRTMADAYLYNRPRSRALVPIAHGDFARWLVETGAHPYGG